MRYEWDPEKRNANWRKHRIRFEDAVRVFDDPYRNDVDVTEDEYGEERWAVIGRMDQSRLAVLFVVYTDRPPDIRRIISARVADREDHDDYHSRLD